MTKEVRKQSFFGYSQYSNAYKLLDSLTGSTIISKDVTFDKKRNSPNTSTLETITFASSGTCDRSGTVENGSTEGSSNMHMVDRK